MGIPFILGLITYMALILGLTLWLNKYHSLKCQRAAMDKNAAKIADNESPNNRTEKPKY